MKNGIISAVMSSAFVCVFAICAFGQQWVQPAEIFVAPNGTPDGEGTREAPLSFKAVFENGAGLQPGTTVWVTEGVYTGPFTQGATTSGTDAAPVIFRAVPGERATIVGGLLILHSNIWVWGMEVVGPGQSGVDVHGGRNVRVINMIIHGSGPEEQPAERRPSGQGIGGWDVGDEHEYYGNLVYNNGWFTLDHGLYTQNTARHTTKRIIDNIIFENAGFGIHIYGSAPALANFLVEGNISFATSQLPRNPSRGECNILIGGARPLNNIEVRNNMTWHPNDDSKRGLDIGFSGSPNRNIVVEDNYLMNGSNAMELKGVAQAEVRGNTFWAPAGMVSVTFAPDDQLGDEEPSVVFENNRYYDNGRFDLDRFRAAINSGETDEMLPGRDGRPTGLVSFLRSNQYEPNRFNLAVYNWDHHDEIEIGLEGLLEEGDSYRVVSAQDFFGEPVVAGVAEGDSILLPMGGRRYEPEFGAYVLFIEKAE